MKPQLAAVILIAIAGCAQAQPVYLCVDQDGKKEYRNTGITKNCKRVSLPGLTTVSAPKKAPATGNAKANANAKKPEAAAPKGSSPALKPRDSDRKEILQEELRSEEQKLEKLKAEYKGGEPDRLGGEKNYAKYQERTEKLKVDIERTEKNIEALKREVANIR